MSQDTHLDDEVVAAYVDGGLDAETRQQAEAHLLECDECRQLLASTARLVARPHRLPSLGVIVAGGLAAAAALVLLLVPQASTPDTTSRTRDIEAAGRNGLHLAAHAPAESDTVRREVMIFRWAAAGDDVTYLLTISNEAGAIVWSERTTDTTLAPSESVRSTLENGRSYYWQVDAVLPNLRSASTGPRRFVPVP